MRARIKSTPGLLAGSAAVAVEEELGKPAAGVAGEGTVDFVSGAILRSIAPGDNVISQITPSGGRGQRAVVPARRYAWRKLVVDLEACLWRLQKARRQWLRGQSAAMGPFKLWNKNVHSLDRYAVLS